MLTIENEKAIERVQKSAIAIILGAEYENYEQGLSNLSLQRLDLRRKKLCTTFARKAAKHPLHSNWFQKNDLDIKVKTRSQKQTYKPVRVRTQRLLRSPIPYMTMLLNSTWILNTVSLLLVVVLVHDYSICLMPYQRLQVVA